MNAADVATVTEPAEPEQPETITLDAHPPEPGDVTLVEPEPQPAPAGAAEPGAAGRIAPRVLCPRRL